MGVQGLTTLLQQYGWMPKRVSCSTSLWREAHVDILSERLQLVPPNSTFAVDGNGLAHYLHDVAYSRYFQQVTAGGSHGKKKKKSTDSTTSCSCRKDLTQQQVVLCLPQSMPLSLLHQVTKEFVDYLYKNQINLVIYWDGQSRRLKAGTTQKRRSDKDNKWSLLYQYCHTGVLPFSNPCKLNFSRSFPNSRLLLQQVRATLSSYAKVQHIHCTEEADREVARASATNSEWYSVGMDSDYCLFPQSKYIPLSTLNASGTNVSACVITREALADFFNLPTSHSMVEMGILMGNDYVESPKQAGFDFYAESLEDIMAHLRLKGADYMVTSRNPDVQLALNFTRALYTFQDLSDFPFDEGDSDEKDNVHEVEDDLPPEDRPRLPDSLDLNLTRLKPLDFSLRDVIMRPIQSYIDTTPDDPPVISQQQFDCFLELNKALELNVDKRRDMKERPRWEDILAAYVIEKCIAYVMNAHVTSPVVKYSSPMKMFDFLSFEAMMNEQLKADNNESQSAAEEKKEADDSNAAGMSVDRPRLPIDEFEADILESIAQQRVTIIHGETGCGKSSRVPVMILRASQSDTVKMFISQPRRIAVKSLVERIRSCEPDLRDKFALRMGHGEREYESNQTRAWFVTTGYLVRLLAANPERFDDVSHLIIDETHERSVESDILCLLCRRLLESNHRIRLILMSATLAAGMYAEYFAVIEPPIEVGGRRFPIKEFFIEDIISKFKLPAKDKKAACYIQEQCEKSKCRSTPSNTHMDNLYQLAVRVTAAVGQPGGSVLIFVAGMNDIISIIDKIEGLYMPGARYTCFPIHSDVPFEEQMAAFDKPAKDEIKVIIGTNAAESSITLPDVDHVVCLGLQKQIIYNPASHRQLLTPAWISRANAVQRAGRTGRVRNGHVYRLYSRAAFDLYMQKFEIGEISRVPLDSTILLMKEMLHEEATPVLLDCLEPPELATIERSFESLHSQNFLTEPDDSGQITSLGSFVSSVGIDLMLGSLIGLGIQFGVGAESIELAAILSFGKSPWVISNPIFHEAAEFNDLTSRTYSSRCHFDANLYSEPLGVMNLLWDYEHVSNRKGFGWHFSLALGRVRRLVSTRNSIRSRVSEFMGCDVKKLTVQAPPVRMPHAKVVLLRIIQVWVFSDNIIQSYQVHTSESDEFFSVTLRKNLVEKEHLSQVLDEKRHYFTLVSHRETEQKGKYTPLSESSFQFSEFAASFVERYLSYCAASGFNMAWYREDNQLLVLFVRDFVAESTSISQMKGDVLVDYTEMTVKLALRSGGNTRGRNGRTCGLWKMHDTESNDSECEKIIEYVGFSMTGTKNIMKLAKFLKIKSLQTTHVDKTVSCHLFANQSSNKKASSLSYTFFTRGQCGPVSKEDAKDMFGAGDIEMVTREGSKPTQEVHFEIRPSSPIPFGSGNADKDLSGAITGFTTSWSRPLLNDIPEGARILSVIASSRRNEHSITFSPLETEGEDGNSIKVELSRTESRITERWAALNTKKGIFVETNCVPAAALSINGPVEVFGVAGDSLELKGGGWKVSGLTLMPPGRLFLLLCMKSFGLHPYSTRFGDEDEEIDQCLGWLNEKDGSNPSKMSDEDTYTKIRKAIEFHDTCRNLGESLKCYPDLVVQLLSIFDMVDGYECLPWPDISEIEAGEGKTSGGRKESTSKRKPTLSNKVEQVQKSTKPAIAGLHQKKSNVSEDPMASKGTQHSRARKGGKAYDAILVTDFSSKNAKKVERRLFAMSLDENSSLTESDLPSSNILSMLVEGFRNAAKASFQLEETPQVPPQWAAFFQLTSNVAQDEPVSLESSKWQVHKVQSTQGAHWWSASYIGRTVPLLSLTGRQNTPVWMRDEIPAPSNPEDANQCVPPNLARQLTFWHSKVNINENGRMSTKELVLYPSLETAVRMGAAFWLERQFFDGTRHWYQIQFEEMMTGVTKTLEMTSRAHQNC